jgi:prophage antirepressor-like protein
MLRGKENKTAIVPFQKDDMNLRSVVFNDAPHFIAADVCNALGLKDTGKALLKLHDTQKQKAPRTQFGLHVGVDIWLINESGLYTLLMRSDKPEAKPFQLWVTNEVLPTLRKTGSYALPNVVEPAPIGASVTQDKVKNLMVDVALRCKKGTVEYRLVKALQELFSEKGGSNG